MNEGVREEAGHPVLAAAEAGFRLLAAVHREQVVHRDGLQVFGDLGGEFVGKEIHQFVGDFQESVVHGHAYGGGGEGLADGMHRVRLVRSGVAVPGLIQHLAVLEDHQALEKDGIVGLVAGEDRIDGFLDGGRGGGAGKVHDFFLPAGNEQDHGCNSQGEDKGLFHIIGF